jgi:hypothetical protein
MRQLHPIASLKLFIRVTKIQEVHGSGALANCFMNVFHRLNINQLCPSRSNLMIPAAAMRPLNNHL